MNKRPRTIGAVRNQEYTASSYDLSYIEGLDSDTDNTKLGYIPDLRGSGLSG